MKRSLTAIMALAAAGMISLTTGCSSEKSTAPAAKEVKAQTICPVMGGKINPELYVDANGKRVYVCCEGCIDAVKQDPQKYIDQLEAAGVAVAPTPTAK